jgi:glycosyltransferase involved in cell wall biosynthesis
VKLSIVIPVYNERRYIAEVLRRVQRVSIRNVEKEIIVVDDCSADGTREFLQEIVKSGATKFALNENEELDLSNIRFFFQEKNQGKGAALRRGFKEVTGDVVIVQDADFEYDPAEYPKLLGPIRKGLADVVISSRFLGSGSHRVMYFWHYVGNKFLTMLSNMFTNLNLTDMETCYKVFKTEILRRVELQQDRFGFEPEITAKVAKLGCRIYEVPISYHGRTYAEGKKIGWKDGFQALYCIVKYGLFS